MDAFTEYALLFVVAAPLVAVILVNLVLMACGERGTLLWPVAERPAWVNNS